MGVLDSLQSAGFSLWFIVLCAVIFLSFASLVNTVIYNLYQHPLHKIPGPKIAGATYLYQSYYSLSGSSTYYKRIRKMHAQYGNQNLYHEVFSNMYKVPSSALLPMRSISAMQITTRSSIAWAPNTPNHHNFTMLLQLAIPPLVVDQMISIAFVEECLSRSSPVETS